VGLGDIKKPKPKGLGLEISTERAYLRHQNYYLTGGVDSLSTILLNVACA